ARSNDAYRVHLAVEANARLDLELGERDEAIALLRSEQMRNPSLDPHPLIDNTINLAGYLYIAGGIGRPEWVRQRDAWVQSRSELMRHQYGAAAYIWIPAYAVVRTSEDAKEAAAKRPEYLPLPDPLNRDAYRDDAIGWTAAMAGDIDEGLSFLRRGANACT